MSELDQILGWVATLFYALTGGLSMYLVVFRREPEAVTADGDAVAPPPEACGQPLPYPVGKAERTALVAAFIGVAVHLASLIARGIDSGHLPVVGNYENASAAALFISFPAAIIAARKRNLRSASFAAITLALLFLGWALLQREVASPLTPAYKSTWLVIHVVFANLAYGAFGLATGAGACFLIKEKRSSQGRPVGKLLDKVPELASLDDYMYRFVVFGFITCALMIVAGAFWADNLWGSYWGWDPVETWSLITFLAYGLFIHLRVVHHWRGRRLAWLAVISIVFVAVSFWGVSVFADGQHSFDTIE